jgi:uncharacterized protein (TIGR02145 family)
MKKRIINFFQLLLMSLFVVSTLGSCEKSNDPVVIPAEEKVTDNDGNTYKTVKIGTQIWSAENLKTTTYNDGTPIALITENEAWSNTTTGAYCNYKNLESNVLVYGRLYNWHAVITGKLAPKGWHIPTDEDWTTLVNYVATDNDTKSSVSKALSSSTNWKSLSGEDAFGHDLTSINTSGFSALPGGSRGFDGIFYLVGNYGYWWSTLEHSSDFAYDRCLSYYYYYLHKEYGSKNCGFSVRLIKDD